MQDTAIGAVQTGKVTHKAFKERALRGGFVTLAGQATMFVLRTGSMMVLARLLVPEEFGVVGMVAVVTGFFNLFKDVGLSMATVQRENITEGQISTLFWINTAVGFVLALFSIALAPVLVAFFHETRLFWIMIFQSSAFIFSGAAAQHQALLQREMRFFALAAIDISSLLASIVVAIGMALGHCGYWALVGMAVSGPAVNMILVWLAAAWVPGLPSRRTGVRAMMRFGGVVTLNNIIVYLAYNAEKVLLGRFWGAEVLGIYGRAYQLVTLPISLLNSSVSRVAFPVFSRVQNDPQRLRNYFLKLYSIVLSLTIPVTLTCALFADEMILVVLGPKWSSAAPIFRFLAPTVLALALINPLGWVLTSTGRVGRSMNMALVIAPVVIAAYFIGISHGPNRVALCYSTVMVLLVVPMTAWAIHGTSISGRDLVKVVSRPLVSGLVAAGAGWVFTVVCGHYLPPIARLSIGVCGVVAVYVSILLGIFGQKEFYMDIIRSLLLSRGDVTEKKGA